MRLKSPDYPVNLLYNSILKWILFNPFWFSIILILGISYKFCMWYTTTYPTKQAGAEWFIAVFLNILIIIVCVIILAVRFSKLYPEAEGYLSDYQKQFNKEESDEKIENNLNKIKKEVEDKCF